MRLAGRSISNESGSSRPDATKWISRSPRTPMISTSASTTDRAPPSGSKNGLVTQARSAPVCDGISRRAYEEALAYSRIRYKGGARIIFHQAVQMAICDMAIKVLTARLMMLRAAWQNDQKAGPNQLNGMAKIYCSDVAVDVTSKAMQVFGGYGYMRDFPMEKLYRDARLGPIYHATNEMIMTGQLAPWLASMNTIY